MRGEGSLIVGMAGVTGVREGFAVVEEEVIIEVVGVRTGSDVAGLALQDDRISIPAAIMDKAYSNIPVLV